MGPLTSIQGVPQDFRYAGRLLGKTPGFTLAAMLTLAIGIGANTSIFSVADAVMLRPLPYPDSNRLVRVWQREPLMGEEHLGAAPPEFVAYRDGTRAFSSIAGYVPASFDLTSGGVPNHVPAYRVTASLFETLGVRPLVGRAFSKEEERESEARVAILSYAFWTRYFGSDPSAVGQTVVLNERRYRIVGVMPAGFTFPATSSSPGAPPALWVPLTFTSRELNDWASSFDTSIVARLRRRMTLEQATADVKRVAQDFQREHADIYSGNILLEANVARWSPDFSARTRVMLWLMTGAVALVLLIACANVANLLLVRAAARQREISIRLALGAGVGSLTRQVLAETALLSIGGGVAGCALANAILKAMNSVAMTEINMAAARLDARVLLFTFAACAAACLFCSWAPVWTLRAISTNEVLKQSSDRQAGAGRANRRLARWFVVGQIACCVVLLIGSGLLFRSFHRILEVSPGFDPDHALTIRTTLNRQRYSPKRRHAVERVIEARLAALPGIRAVALTTHLPLADERKIGFVIDGQRADEFHWADNALVSADYFRVMKIPLLRGRTFSDADTVESPPVAVVNQAMAKRYWPDEDPIGKGFKWGGRHLTVIGVVGDVHVEALDQPVSPTIYNSVYQTESGASTSAVFVLRAPTLEDPMRLAATAQSTIWSVDNGLPIISFGALRDVISGSLAIRRLSLSLLGVFSLMALLLSLIGVYGVLSNAVAQQSHEIGVRIALGAKPGQIAGRVGGEGARLACIGISAGVVAGAFSTKFLSKLLFGVPSLDWMSFLGSVLGLFAVAILGSYLPARRASRVDPMVALRDE